MIIWTDEADFCLIRIQQYLKANDVDNETIEEILNEIGDAPDRLLQFPRMGQKLAYYGSKDRYRLLVRDYKIYYEIQGDVIVILDVIHAKQDTQGVDIKVCEE